MSAKGKAGSKSVKDDRYYTPAWVVNQCFQHVTPHLESCATPPRILDPGAGRGAFVDGARAKYPTAEITALDLDPKVGPWPNANHSLVSTDFLKWNIDKALIFDLVVGNPPYKLAQKFLEHALGMSQYVVFLLRVGFLASARRYDFLLAHPPAAICLLPNRPRFIYPDGVPRSSDQTEYAIMRWERRPGLRPAPRLFWLPKLDRKERA
jgi:predicted RNA methylase